MRQPFPKFRSSTIDCSCPIIIQIMFNGICNIGFDYFLDDTKYVNFDIKKYLLSTDASIDAGPAGTANASIDLNPLTLGFGVGWLF